MLEWSADNGPACIAFHCSHLYITIYMWYIDGSNGRLYMQAHGADHLIIIYLGCLASHCSGPVGTHLCFEEKMRTKQELTWLCAIMVFVCLTFCMFVCILLIPMPRPVSSIPNLTILGYLTGLAIDWTTNSNSLDWTRTNIVPLQTCKPQSKEIYSLLRVGPWVSFGGWAICCSIIAL